MNDARPRSGKPLSLAATILSLAFPVVFFLVVAWGYKGPSEVDSREAWYLDTAVRGGRGLEDQLAFSASSPAYQMLLRLWMLRGADVRWARQLSLWLGVAGVISIWGAGRALFGVADGVAAALLVGLSPLYFHHTHLASPLPLFWCLGAASVGLWHFSLRGRALYQRGLYVIAAVLVVHAGPLGAALVAVQVAMALWRVLAPTRREAPARRPVLHVVVTSVVLIALIVPRVAAGIRHPGPPMATGQKVTGITGGLLARAYQDLAGGAGFGPAALGALAFVGVVVSVRKRMVKSRILGRVYVDKRRRRPVLCLLWTVVAGVLAASLFTVPMARSLEVHHLHGILPFVLLLGARGVVVAAAGVGRLVRSLFGITMPSEVLSGAIALALLLPTSLDAFRRERVAATAGGEGWRHVGERVVQCLKLGGQLLVLPRQAAAALRWNTDALPEIAEAKPSPSDIGPGTLCLVAVLDELPPVPENLQRACEERLQEVDRYTCPAVRGFFSLRADRGTASVARRMLAALARLEADPGSVDAARELAEAYLDARLAGDARSILENIATSEQFTAQDVLQLALIEERMGLPGVAFERYGDVLRLQPECAQAHARLGAILAARGELRESRAHLEESLRLLPLNVEAMETLGGVLAAQGDREAESRLVAELGALEPAVRADGEFAGRFSLKGYSPHEGTVSSQEEPLAVAYYLQCLRPVPAGHSLRHRLVGKGIGLSHQTVSPGDSAVLAAARPGETVVVGCELGVTWSAASGKGELQLGMTSPDGLLLPAGGVAGAWLPVAVLTVRIGEAREPVKVVEASSLQRDRGSLLVDGLSVSRDGAWTEFSLPSGWWKVTVVARGVPAGGEWPRMAIDVDGEERTRMAVADQQWLELSCPIGEGPGEVRLGVRFLNTYYNRATGENRGLVVREVRLAEEPRLLVMSALE